VDGVQPPLTLIQGKYVALQLLSALAFLHDRGLIHRDVKPENMLVFGSDVDPASGERYPLVKISDFGLCRAIDPDAVKYTTRVGTKSYRAPETTGGRYDNKVDVFSAGAT
jgi:serine/threonine protein kinase